MLKHMQETAKLLVESRYQGYTLKKKNVLFFGAVEYEKDDADFLAGPFEHNNKYYGLVYVTTETKLQPIAEILKQMHHECMNNNSETWMPYSVRRRIKDYFKSCICYRDNRTNMLYSSLDLEYGKNEIKPEILDRLVSLGETGLFFKTEGAKKEILSWFTQSELNEWHANLKDFADKVCFEVERTTPCIEKPYKIYLYGTDDTSFTTTVATEKDWKNFVKNMNTSTFVHENMLFTN